MKSRVSTLLGYQDQTVSQTTDNWAEKDTFAISVSSKLPIPVEMGTSGEKKNLELRGDPELGLGTSVERNRSPSAQQVINMVNGFCLGMSSICSL